MAVEGLDDRSVFAITGGDRISFLQGLVTNDLNRLKDGLVYAAHLTPQGKYIADFFLTDRGDAILLDVKTDLAPALVQRLSLYKLRADVAIEPAGFFVRRGLGTPPDGALSDPRHSALGWRLYGDASDADTDTTDWDALRVHHVVPEAGTELSGDSFILEYGFERLNGVDFRKGCYVGQEVTARMKHKTELRKGLAQVKIDGPAADPGTPILANGKVAGTLGTRAGNLALAYLRFDRAEGPMTAGEARVEMVNATAT